VKKAFLVAMCFVAAGFLMVNDTFASDFSKAITDIFATIAELGGNGAPSSENDKISVKLETTGDNQPLYPGSSVTRRTSVKNEGTDSAYVRLVYAVQYDPETWGKGFRVSFECGEGFTQESFNGQDFKPIKIGSAEYRMYVFTWQSALAGTSNTANSASTSEVAVTVSMDGSITTEQMKRYRSDFLRIQALAIETASFTNKEITSAEDALNMALPLDTLKPF